MPGCVTPLSFLYRGRYNCYAYFTLQQETRSYLKRENDIVLRKDGSLNYIDSTVVFSYITSLVF